MATASAIPGKQRLHVERDDAGSGREYNGKSAGTCSSAGMGAARVRHIHQAAAQRQAAYHARVSKADTANTRAPITTIVSSTITRTSNLRATSP